MRVDLSRLSKAPPRDLHAIRDVQREGLERDRRPHAQVEEPGVTLKSDGRLATVGYEGSAQQLLAGGGGEVHLRVPTELGAKLHARAALSFGVHDSAGGRGRRALVVRRWRAAARLVSLLCHRFPVALGLPNGQGSDLEVPCLMAPPDLWGQPKTLEHTNRVTHNHTRRAAAGVPQVPASLRRLRRHGSRSVAPRVRGVPRKAEAGHGHEPRRRRL